MYVFSKKFLYFILYSNSAKSSFSWIRFEEA